MAREGNVQLFPKGLKYYEHFDNIHWGTIRPDQRPDLGEAQPSDDPIEADEGEDND